MKGFFYNHWLVASVLILVSLAYPFGIEGAGNLAAFMLWGIMVPLQFMALGDSAIEACAKGLTKRMPAPILKRCMALAIVVISAWYGAFWTASAMLIAAVLGMAYTMQINKAFDSLQMARAVAQRGPAP